jgi:hypothetical protein
MLNFNKEIIVAAKGAKSLDELMALAKENSIEITEEEAALYFEQLNPKSGEISDEELNNVSGGMDRGDSTGGCGSTDLKKSEINNDIDISGGDWDPNTRHG